MTEIVLKLLGAVMALGAAVGYIRARVNGLVDEVKQLRRSVDDVAKRVEEQKDKYYSCKARIQAELQSNTPPVD